MELSLAQKEFCVMDNPPTVRIENVRHHRVTHLMIDHVFEKPCRDYRPVKQRVNSDNPVMLLNRSEDDFIPRALPAAASPHDSVAFQPVAKIAGIELVENDPQIKKTALLLKRKLSLER